jgi:hypothetical protein
MSVRGRFLLPTICLVSLWPLSGCMTAVKQVFHEARGAKAKVLLVADVGERSLASYQGLRFEPATTTIGANLCPPGLLTYYDDHTRGLTEALRETFPGGEPVLQIGTEVTYFQKKGALSQAEFLARVRMRDGGRVVVDALLRAESKSFRRGGENALAEAAVEALRKFLKKQKVGGEPDDDDK